MKPNIKKWSGVALAMLASAGLAVTQAEAGQRHAVPRERNRAAEPTRPAPPDNQRRDEGRTDQRPGDRDRSADRAGSRESPRRSQVERRPIVVVPDYYAWPSGFGGVGYYGGYYGGYYDPYDPWYGSAGYQGYNYASSYEGSLRLKIKQRDAAVYVDGYYAGIVDDFDGFFQRLKLEGGPHRIEVRAAGYQTLTFDVQIRPDHLITYEGDLAQGP
jgi:hypothetical protein